MEGKYDSVGAEVVRVGSTIALMLKHTTSSV